MCRSSIVQLGGAARGSDRPCSFVRGGTSIDTIVAMTCLGASCAPQIACENPYLCNLRSTRWPKPNRAQRKSLLRTTASTRTRSLRTSTSAKNQRPVAAKRTRPSPMTATRICRKAGLVASEPLRVRSLVPKRKRHQRRHHPRSRLQRQGLRTRNERPAKSLERPRRSVQSPDPSKLHGINSTSRICVTPLGKCTRR